MSSEVHGTEVRIKYHWTYPDVKFGEMDQVKSTENILKGSAVVI